MPKTITVDKACFMELNQKCGRLVNIVTENGERLASSVGKDGFDVKEGREPLKVNAGQGTLKSLGTAWNESERSLDLKRSARR